jgi:hypothetical protein
MVEVSGKNSGLDADNSNIGYVVFGRVFNLGGVFRLN